MLRAKDILPKVEGFETIGAVFSTPPERGPLKERCAVFILVPEIITSNADTLNKLNAIVAETLDKIDQFAKQAPEYSDFPLTETK